jgi:hypothetical protein
MKSGILAALVAIGTAGGLTYLFVGTGKHCGPCVSSSTATPQAAEKLTDDENGMTSCCDGACKWDFTSRVYDVADLKAGYQINGEVAPFVSFDEPPLAKRPADVQRVGFEAKADGPEVLPPPREVK